MIVVQNVLLVKLKSVEYQDWLVRVYCVGRKMMIKKKNIQDRGKFFFLGECKVFCKKIVFSNDNVFFVLWVIEMEVSSLLNENKVGSIVLFFFVLQD